MWAFSSPPPQCPRVTWPGRGGLWQGQSRCRASPEARRLMACGAGPASPPSPSHKTDSLSGAASWSRPVLRERWYRGQSPSCHSLSTSGVPKQLSVGAPSFPSLSDRRGMGAQRGEAACPRSRGHAAGKGRDWGLGPGCPARPSPQSPGIGQLGQPAFSPEASGTHPPGAVHRTPHPGNPHAQGGECWVSPRSRPLFWGS